MGARAITRRRTLAGLALAAMAKGAAATQPSPALSEQDRALVAKASAYLQTLSSAKGRFVQTDARGVVSQGSFYLQRPGKARFAYDPPSGLVIASNGKVVNILNTRLRTFASYYLKLTPLALFLARDMRLDQGVAVSKVTHLADGFSIVASDARKQAEGKITLDFAEAPIRLVGWTATDAQGGATRVRLVDFAPTGPLDHKLFELANPRYVSAPVT
ncbi:MAG TPA: outer-membrane lipoprotein carrier protein LolA [Caulobacteraceae bacterium]